MPRKHASKYKYVYYKPKDKVWYALYKGNYLRQYCTQEEALNALMTFINDYEIGLTLDDLLVSRPFF